MNPSYDTEAATKPTDKRLRDPEEETALPDEYVPPGKRAKQTASNTSQPLTAECLKRHTLHEGYLERLELMNSKADQGSESRGSKMSALGDRIHGDTTSTISRGLESLSLSQVTQKSSFTAAHYRKSILEGVNVYFQFRLPPEDIHARITAIVQLDISPAREEELLIIGRKFHDDFVIVLNEAAREDDCVELFYQALSSMRDNENLTLPRKADWLPYLKPRAPPAPFTLDNLYKSADKAKEPSQPPNKRQRNKAYLSPDTSGAACTVVTTESPSSPPSQVKTPRPDISIGLSDAAVRKALQSQGLTGRNAKHLLIALATPDPRNGGMPLLYSMPTQASLEIRFPFFLVEGKSYATSRTIYEAQNQAAVSGACSLKILHDLDDLVCKSDPENYSKRQPIVFSVCTEGPIHQLWAHYTTVDDAGDRVYYMAQVKTCDVGIWDGVSGFLQAVDNVLKWGSGEHKEAIAKQLHIIWQHLS